MNLKTAIALVSITLFTATVSAEHPTSASEHPKPKSEHPAAGGEHPASKPAMKAAVLAVVFHADWCPNCKELGPRLAAVEPEFSGTVEFVRLDLTNDETKKEAAARAAEFGLTDLHQSNAGKTGVVYLFDRKSGKTLQQIDSSMDPDAIRAAMKAALEGTASAKPSKSEHPKSEHPKSEHPSSEHPK